jgi:seryl-tRNA synthetase
MKKATLIEAKYSNQQINKNLEELKKSENKDRSKIAELNNKIKDNVSNMEKEFETLNKEFKEITDLAQKQRLDFNKLMNEEADVKLWTIKYENLPKEITIGQRKIIEELITNVPKEEEEL